MNETLQLLASLVTGPDAAGIPAPATPTAGDDGAIVLFLVAACIAAVALLVRPEPAQHHPEARRR